ncbi:alpha/beta hydrolase [Catenuloplanes indicus]|uniref:Alpha-beta hydrolase superfamily lysophospholipase n=1 Tax=Catenuloplanes indicus TaxID=137267 RepID=A0AAE3W6M0_9ACTN|nr:alpha/beta fold hydrolase [Catenuloplanes indicus]MDQ0370823.1 alpha-beta hydrolase superfamily lysophospholipase [Catenuloplanes indicus]
MPIRQWWSVLVAGMLAVAAGLTCLILADRGLRTEAVRAGGVPVEIVRGPGATGARPAVVVVHGYAGSGRLMRPFADTLARRGYVVLLPDLAGHGANTRRLDVPAVIDAEIASVVAHARGLPDVDPDRVTLLGHSMGAGAVVRAGAADRRIAATVAISLPGSGTGPGPRRLLLIVGALEPGGFRTAAERAAGDRAAGDRRLVSVPLVEHISVLFAPRTHREAAGWLDAAAGNAAAGNTAAGAGIVPLRRVAAGALTMLGALLLLAAALARGGTGSPAGRPPNAAAATSRASTIRALVARWPANVAASAIRRPADSASPASAIPRSADSAASTSPASEVRRPAGFAAPTSPASATRADPVRRPVTWLAVAAASVLGVLGGGIGAVAAPAPVTGYLIGFFAAVGGGLALAAGLLTGWRRPPVPRWTAAVPALAGGAAVVVPVQLGLTLMVPHGDRWWLVAALALATAALLAGARALAGPGWDLAVLAGTAVPLAAAAVTGLAPGFLMLIAPLLAVLFALCALLAAVARRGGAAWWPSIAAGAVMIAWPVAVALPVSAG